MGIFSDVLLTVDYDRTMTAPDSTIPEINIEAIRYLWKTAVPSPSTPAAASP